MPYGKEYDSQWDNVILHETWFSMQSKTKMSCLNMHPYFN